MQDYTLHYLILSTILFSIGIFGMFFSKKSIISLILSIEIILLAVALNFVTFASYLNNITGHIFVMFILAVSACEMALLLMFLVVYYYKNSSIWVEDLQDLRG